MKLLAQIFFRDLPQATDKGNNVEWRNIEGLIEVDDSGRLEIRDSGFIDILRLDNKPLIVAKVPLDNIAMIIFTENNK